MDEVKCNCNTKERKKIQFDTTTKIREREIENTHSLTQFLVHIIYFV